MQPDLYTYRATVLNIVDADTIDLRVDLGFKVFQETRVRLSGINAWELRGPERMKGKQATQRVLELCPVDSDVLIRTEKDRTGKYGRYLARIALPHLNDADLGEILVNEGHAVPQPY